MHTALTGTSTIEDLADLTVAAVVELGQTRLRLRAARQLSVGTRSR